MAIYNSLVVCGGGPAGLSAAIAAARAGAKVLLLEKMSLVGMRLSATGGGHCNFTNSLPPGQFMERFGRNGRFMAHALEAMDRESLREFLAGVGEPSACADGFHFFPVSNSAKAVRDALVAECAGLGVEIRTGAAATGLLVGDGSIRGVQIGQDVVAASAVLLASGGISRTEMGGDPSGLEMASAAGHAIVHPVPALVPLVTRETWPGRLAGVSLAGCRVRAALRGCERTSAEGAVLFTHRGISGPAVLDISGSVARAIDEGREVVVELALFPGTGIGDWTKRLGEWRENKGMKSLVRVLSEQMPLSLAGILAEKAGIAKDTRVSRLNRDQATALARLLAALPVTISGTEGFTQAMATRGGIALKDIDPRTMESRVVRGLFFAGEIIDLDGPCGGFNLQWAFSSGFLAGRSAAVYAGSGGPAAWANTGER